MQSLHTPTIRRALILVIVFLCGACETFKFKEAETQPGKNGAPVSTSAPAATRAPAATGSSVATGSSTPLDKAQQELANGIASYENGNYKASVRQLQAALTLGLEAPDKQASAHKYLAFMHCVNGRERLCREEFHKALAVDPAFDLTPSEAGHPTWGPVFRKLKSSGKPASK